MLYLSADSSAYKLLTCFLCIEVQVTSEHTILLAAVQ